jgi:hypothetical protein
VVDSPEAAKARWHAIKEDPKRLAAVKRRNKETFLMSKYGITLIEYEAMLKKQRGRCAICRKKPSGRWGTLHVDHCHKTGRVRGLLCHRCNSSLLPAANDDPAVLERAAAYLRAA